MAELGQTFNIDDLPEEEGFDPIPAGEYRVAIKGAELKPTKDGTGKYIALRLDVLGPSHQGRVIFSNVNIQNRNPDAEKIGQQQLGSIARAIGVKSVSNTDQLLGGELAVKVVVKSDPEYGPRNEVKRFKATGDASPQFASQASQPAKPSTEKAPWAQ